MLNLGQMKLNNKNECIRVNLETSDLYYPEAAVGYNEKKEKEKKAIHEEILRVSLEELSV